jgi:hypothetical protein
LFTKVNKAVIIKPSGKQRTKEFEMYTQKYIIDGINFDMTAEAETYAEAEKIADRYCDEAIVNHQMGFVTIWIIAYDDETACNAVEAYRNINYLNITELACWAVRNYAMKM